MAGEVVAFTGDTGYLDASHVVVTFATEVFKQKGVGVIAHGEEFYLSIGSYRVFTKQGDGECAGVDLGVHNGGSERLGVDFYHVSGDVAVDGNGCQVLVATARVGKECFLLSYHE